MRTVPHRKAAGAAWGFQRGASALAKVLPQVSVADTWALALELRAAAEYRDTNAHTRTRVAACMRCIRHKTSCPFRL